MAASGWNSLFEITGYHTLLVRTAFRLSLCYFTSISDGIYCHYRLWFKSYVLIASQKQSFFWTLSYKPSQFECFLWSVVCNNHWRMCPLWHLQKWPSGKRSGCISQWMKRSSSIIQESYQLVDEKTWAQMGLVTACRTRQLRTKALWLVAARPLFQFPTTCTAFRIRNGVGACSFAVWIISTAWAPASNVLSMYLECVGVTAVLC